MKKKLLSMMVVALVVIAAGSNVYMSKNKVDLSDFILLNIEALAGGGGEGSGYYKKTTSQCPPPVQYKTAVSCRNNGTEECSPSDC